MKLSIFLLKENKDNLLDYIKQEKKELFFNSLTNKSLTFDETVNNYKFIEENGYIDDIQYTAKNFFSIDWNPNNIVLFFNKSETIPEWINFFDSINLTTKNKCSSSVSCLFIKKIKVENIQDDIIFAITFGFGHTLLKDDYIEQNFGLKTALNLSDGKSIFSIENTDIRTFSNKSEKKVNHNSSINDYEIDKVNYLLTKITLKIKIFDKEITARGKDSISFDWNIKQSNISELLVEIYKNFKSDKYKENYSWIDNIKNVRDTNLIDSLNKNLIKFLKEDFLKQDYDDTRIFLDLNTNLEWEQISEICVAKKSFSENNITILDFKEIIEKNFDKFSLNFLKNKLIEIKNSEGDICENASIYKCLIFETDLNDKKYLLYKTTWYELEKNYVDQINNDWNDVKNNQKFNAYLKETQIKKNEKEADFNERLSKSEKNCFLLDKEIFRLTGKNDFEFCDVLNYSKKEIIHVKIYRSSANLSHLFNQGYVSAKIFASKDDIFLKKLSEKTKLPIDEIRKQNYFDYKVVFGIVTNSNANIPAIPFFSKITFFAIKKEIENYLKMKVEIVNIRREK